MSDSTIIEARPLPLGATSQKAELTALARALTLAKDNTVNIYTDSKYVFHTLLSHSAIWKERGFLTTRGIPTINVAFNSPGLRGFKPSFPDGHYSLQSPPN
jgi:hypothetical protein